MKAVYFNEHGDISVLRYGDLPEPQVPEGWVKLRVKATSFNHADLFVRRGMPGIKVQLPGINGTDCAGEIAELGPGVQGWQVGERVLPISHEVDWKAGRFDMLGENRNGAMAEYCTVRASQLMRLPDAVSFEDAACLPCAYGTAYHMLHTRGRIQAGETMLVLGASGGVGNACVLLGKIAGLRVIAAAGDDEKCRRLRELGADETINYNETAVDAWVKEKTGTLLRGGGVDVVVNFTAGDTWLPSMRCVKRHGRLLCCGGTGGYKAVTDIPYLFMSEMDVIGATGWTMREQQACVDLVASGALKPVIDRVVPLAEAIDAYGDFERREFFGKIVVKP